MLNYPKNNYQMTFGDILSLALLGRSVLFCCFCVTNRCSKYLKCFCIISPTVSYQYLSYLFYRDIQLLSFILCYCNLIYNRNVILLCLICNHHITLLFPQILNKFLCEFFQTLFFASDKQIHNLPEASITPTQKTIQDGYLSGVGLLW